jgi:cytochrome c biogenesis protein CcmG/thiol:disulfide interchange protein DsbE
MNNAAQKAKTTTLDWLLLVLIPCLILGSGGCDKKTSSQQVAPVDPCVTEASEPELPCVETAGNDANEIDPMAVPRFAANSPFDANYTAPATEKTGKILWAKSYLYEKAPDLVVEKWLTEQPDTQGKCVLIEFWATWCPPCRKSVALLNQLHHKFGEDLVVIGISEETEQAVRKMKEPVIDYAVAIDTQQRMKKTLEVRGIPHVIILEPEGYVIWEGFPLLAGYELTEDIVAKIIQISQQPAGN